MAHNLSQAVGLQQNSLLYDFEVSVCLFHFDVDNFDVLKRLVIAVCLGLLDCYDHIISLCDLHTYLRRCSLTRVLTQHSQSACMPEPNAKHNPSIKRAFQSRLAAHHVCNNRSRSVWAHHVQTCNCQLTLPSQHRYSFRHVEVCITTVLLIHLSAGPP